MNNYLLLAVAMLFCVVAEAQEVNCRALTERNSGASMVNVCFKNKANNVVTNADGTFKIMATNLPDTLVFTSAGYEPYEVIVTEKNVRDPNFEVVLLDRRGRVATDDLSDVVVTSGGYAAPASGTSMDVVSREEVRMAPASAVGALGSKASGGRVARGSRTTEKTKDRKYPAPPPVGGEVTPESDKVTSGGSTVYSYIEEAPVDYSTRRAGYAAPTETMTYLNGKKFMSADSLARQIGRAHV